MFALKFCKIGIVPFADFVIKLSNQLFTPSPRLLFFITLFLSSSFIAVSNPSISVDGIPNSNNCFRKLSKSHLNTCKVED